MKLIKTKKFLKNSKKLLTFKKLCVIISTEDKTRIAEGQEVNIMKIRNVKELEKIDRTKPHAFEMITMVDDEVSCVAYITTSEQWTKFIENYTDAWVMTVEDNVARIWVEKL